MNLGEKIRILRLSQDMTLQKLSEKIDISVSFLSDIEHNRSKPSLSRLKEIASGLNTCVSYLLDDEAGVNLDYMKNYSQYSNLLCDNDLVSDDLIKRIILELVLSKSWPKSEKLDLLKFVQNKNKQLLNK